ncbi:hypothetical protein [Kitasatospora sp. P5_F3]
MLLSDRWEEVVLVARERARARQAVMVERFGLSGGVRYHRSMDDVQLHFLVRDLAPTAERR